MAGRSFRANPVGAIPKDGFVEGFQDLGNGSLHDAVSNGRDSERTELRRMLLWDVCTAYWLWLVTVLTKFVCEVVKCLRRYVGCDVAIHARRMAPFVVLNALPDNR